jgi:hypothetical protein
MSTSEFNSVVTEFFDVQGWSCTAYIQKYTDGGYDVNTSEGIVNLTEYPIRAIPFDYVNKFQGTSTQDGTLIRTGDKQVFIKPSQYVASINPESDKLRMNGTVYKIITVKEFNPTLDNVLYYELFVRA